MARARRTTRTGFTLTEMIVSIGVVAWVITRRAEEPVPETPDPEPATISAPANP